MTGVLRGFDQFMNIVLDETVDMATQEQCGMVVRIRRSAPAVLEDCNCSQSSGRQA